MTTKAKLLFPDYSPSKYTPTSGNVDGHLEGIDNAIPGGAERLPTEAVFTEVYRSVWFDSTEATEYRIQPEALTWVDDDFSDTSLTRFTISSESTQSTPSIASNEFTLTSPAGVVHSAFVSEGDPIEVPQVFMQVTISDITGTEAAYKAHLLGLIKDSDNYVFLNYNSVNGEVVIQTKVSGVSTFSGSVLVSSDFPFKLGFLLIGDYVDILFYSQTTSTWELVESLDLRTVSLGGFKTKDCDLWYPAFGVANPSDYLSVSKFKDFKVSRFGGFGLRDHCVVTNEDGSSYTGLGASQRYVLATIAGYHGIQTGSQGVFIFDTNKKTLTQTGLIFVERDGALQNDHASHAYVDGSGNISISISSWGDVETQQPMVRRETTSTDIFNGTHILSSTVQLNLSVLPSGGSNYDPFIIKEGSYFYIAYTVSGSTDFSFYPVLDRSLDGVTWTNVGSDPDSTSFEGSRIVSFNNTNYALYGGPDSMRMYTLDTFTYYGLANVLLDGEGTQPHAMIWPEESIFWLLTFDAYSWPGNTGPSFSWGRIRLFASPRY